MSEARQHFLGQEKGLYLVVSAPSGAGKTTICKEILRLYPNIKYSVSYTTRPPRPGEVDGKDYHFVSQDYFQERVAAGGFAEWSENFGYLYGTSIDAMTDDMRQGFDLMLDVEPNGAKAIKRNYPGGAFIFIMPPSMDELKKRLIGRGAEGSENLKLRINQAVDMMREYYWYDYVIFNDDLSDAIDCFRSIYIAEKSKRDRWEGRVKRFLNESV